MKHRAIIITLFISIIIVLFIDTLLVLNNKEKLNTKKKYSCIGTNIQQKIENLEITYQKKSRYEFYVTDMGQLESGTIITEFLFENALNYDEFIAKIDNSIEQRIKEYDRNHLKITYYLANTFPNFKEENHLHYTKEYLNILEEYGFICENDE